MCVDMYVFLLSVEWRDKKVEHCLELEQARESERNEVRWYTTSVWKQITILMNVWNMLHTRIHVLNAITSHCVKYLFKNVSTIVCALDPESSCSPLQKPIQRKIDYTNAERVREKWKERNQKFNGLWVLDFYCFFPGFSFSFYFFFINWLCEYNGVGGSDTHIFCFHSIFFSTKGSLYVPKGA